MNCIHQHCFLCNPFFFQVGFKHHKDYVGYTWAKQEESDYLRQEHHVRHETLNTCRCEVELSFSEEGRQSYLYSRVYSPVFCIQVTFAEEELPKESGDYILGYYSNNMNSVAGVTEPFQVTILT